MANYFTSNRLRNIFEPPNMIGNDLPSQGGFTGQIPMPQSPFLGNIPSESPYGRIDFGPTGLYEGAQIPGEIAPPATPPDTYDAAARMRELYQPTSDATQRFENILNQYPQEQRPSWLRAIGAMITDYTRGPEAGQAVFDRNRQQRIADWKNQVVPMQQAANLERQENVNARTLAYQQISAELKDRALDAKMKNDEATAKVRQQRADTYDWAKRHPTMKIIFPKGGNVTGVNPITGESIPIADADGNPIPTGTMTELDKMNLQRDYSLERIGETAEQARITEGVRQQGREQISENRGWKPYEETLPDGTKRTFMYNEITGEQRDRKPGGLPESARPVSGAGAGAKPETAANARVREFNAARRLVNTSPTLGKWIHLGTPGSNDFKVDKPQKGYFNQQIGPSPQEYMLIQQQIYGQAVPSHEVGGTITGGTTPGSATPLTEPPPAPAGWKYVKKPDGTWTAVPDTVGGLD